MARVAAIKAGGDLSYADAFCIATALAAEAPFWTGDPEIIERPAIIRASSSTFGLDAPVEAPIT